MDVLILKINETEEARRRDRDERTKQKKNLVAVGEQILQNAVFRKQSVEDNSAEFKWSTLQKRQERDQRESLTESVEKKLDREQTCRNSELNIRMAELEHSKRAPHTRCGAWA